MDTDLDNRFLIVGHNQRIRSHILTEDGKRLMWTGHMLLGMGDVLPVAARPQRLATVRAKGALPPDLYSHCPGVAIATYRGGHQLPSRAGEGRSEEDRRSSPITRSRHP